MKIKKLNVMPYAQAHIEIDDNGNKNLFSYVTLVASVTNDGWLTVYGLYSATTRKHIGAFVKECSNGVLDYHCAKAAYNDNYSINIFTGEVVDLNGGDSE